MNVRMNRRRVATLLAGLAGLAATGRVGWAAQDPSGTVDKTEVTLTAADLLTRSADYDSLGLPAPKDGPGYLIVSARLKNVGPDGRSYRSGDFYLLADGVAIKEDGGLSDKVEARSDLESMGDFAGTRLEPGETREFVFVYPVTAEGATFAFHVSLGDGLEFPLDEIASGPPSSIATSTPAPTPTATPTASQVAGRYPQQMTDVRLLVAQRARWVGEKVHLIGTISWVEVAAVGKKVNPTSNFTGAFADGYDVAFIVMVPTPDGSDEAVMVGFNGDADGLLEGVDVEVFGIVSDDVSEAVNAYGKKWEIPLVSAELLRH